MSFKKSITRLLKSLNSNTGAIQIAQFRQIKFAMRFLNPLRLNDGSEAHIERALKKYDIHHNHIRKPSQ